MRFDRISAISHNKDTNHCQVMKFGVSVITIRIKIIKSFLSNINQCKYSILIMSFQNRKCIQRKSLLEPNNENIWQFAFVLRRSQNFRKIHLSCRCDSCKVPGQNSKHIFVYLGELMFVFHQLVVKIDFSIGCAEVMPSKNQIDALLTQFFLA